MKKKSIICLTFLLVVLTGCSNNQENAETSTGEFSGVTQFVESNTEEMSTSETANMESQMEESNMIEILNNLVDGNYTCITKLFYYGHLPFDDTETTEQHGVAKVKSSEFQSIADIRSFLSSIYVSDTVEELINNYSEGEPLYFEKDGVLYEYLDAASFAGMATPWGSYKINIIDKTDEQCRFEAIVQFPADELRVGADTASYQFTAVNENGWKLKGVVQKPNT